ncbi:hypothetical protein A1O3_05650, partial [Capronia epimyces CBS 606.96]
MNGSASNGPTPSKFVFISELPALPAATKVRFLGCVVEYDSLRGRLLLEHTYPKNAHPIPRASVDVNLVLESTPSSALERGRWINVIGYTQSTHHRFRKRKADSAHVPDQAVPLQAILIWDAGPLRIADYETALEDHSQIRQ